MNAYQTLIATHLNDLKRPDVQPRLIEAYMRLEHPTLDGLSPREFKREVGVCVECIDDTMASDPRMPERIAQSFGL